MFVWSELKEGLRFSSNGAFCTFFFFFFFFEFRPESAVSADTADSDRFTPIQAQIGPIRSRVSASRHESALKKWKPRGMTRRDAARRAGSGVPRDSPHPAASDAGAAPLVPRPCFTASSRTLTNDNYSTVTFLYWWVIQNNEFIFIPVRVFKRCNVSFFNFLL